MRLIVTRDGVRHERMLSGQTELRNCLREHFGIEFDPATDLSALAV